MLTKTQTIAAVEIAPSGIVTAVTHINVMDGDTLVSQSASRHSVNPGEDYSAEEPVVRAVCGIVHTPECIAAFTATDEPSDE